MRVVLPLLALVAAPPAAAQTAPATAAPPAAAKPAAPPAPVAASAALTARAAALPGLLNGSVAFEDFFAPSVRAQLTKAQFDAVTKQILADAGPAATVRALTPVTANSGTVTLAFRDAVGTFDIAVDPAPPHAATGLLFRGLNASEASLDAVAKAFQALPGTTSLGLARLGANGPEWTIRHNIDQPLAIGSAFKLVILAELVRATRAGERKWDDAVTIDGTPLPGGGYTQKPAGTQVTLRELAGQMIAVSDNSATDILLRTLGREKVEAMMPVLGIADPARNRPFLSTLEAFKLKGVEGGALGRRYLAADTAGRRALLAGAVAATPIAAIDPMLFRDGKPVMIDRIEWYLSASDLARTLDWLRRATEGPDGAEARTILSRNPGIIRPVATQWAYVGYKGGSEPGVMNMSLLLKAASGDWYVLVGSWNDPAQEVQQGRMAALMSRAAELAVPAPR